MHKFGQNVYIFSRGQAHAFPPPSAVGAKWGLATPGPGAPAAEGGGGGNARHPGGPPQGRPLPLSWLNGAVLDVLDAAIAKNRSIPDPHRLLGGNCPVAFPREVLGLPQGPNSAQPASTGSCQNSLCRSGGVVSNDGFPTGGVQPRYLLAGPRMPWVGSSLSSPSSSSSQNRGSRAPTSAFEAEVQHLQEQHQEIPSLQHTPQPLTPHATFQNLQLCSICSRGSAARACAFVILAVDNSLCLFCTNLFFPSFLHLR